MKYYLLVAFLLYAFVIEAQTDNKPKLDLLRATSSPAANLLGFAVSDIEKPTDVTDFMLTLQSATNNYTILPSNFAVDLAPFWLFRAKGLTTDKLSSSKFGDVFKQSFVLSTAFRFADSTTTEFNKENIYQGLGVKFSVVRGKLSEQTTSILDSIVGIQKKMAADITPTLVQKLDADSAYQRLKSKRRELLAINPQDPAITEISLEMEKRQKQIASRIVGEFAEEITALKKLAGELKIERFGFFTDFAAGLTMEYVNQNFSNSRVYNSGAWLSLGANYQSGWTILGLARYLYNPEKIFADDLNTLKQSNLSTFDAGARIIYGHPDTRFNISTEAIYRSVLNKNTIDPSWRFILNAEYDIGNNTRLTFIFGRAFNGTVTREGNVVAALNFLKGLGNRR